VVGALVSSLALLAPASLALCACAPDAAPSQVRRNGHGPARVAAAVVERLASSPFEATDPTMVRLDGGAIVVGDHQGREQRVRVGPFAIDRTEVTVAAYVRCINAGGCRPKWSSMLQRCNLLRPSRFGHPMNCMGREEAAAYCAWAGKRLPTAAEWQFAAAGAEGRRYPSGSMPPEPGELCWKSGATCDVAREGRPTTPEGVTDLAGNVWELSERLCAVDAPRPGLCANFTALVHGGGFDSCQDDQRSCHEMGRSQQVARLDEVSRIAVGFRCVSDGGGASG
jgi:formylglycine-generating enzyme required for sulfatase activity